MTHMQHSPQNGRPSSPILPGFLLNDHPNYIPFKLVDNKMGQQIPTKYVLFLNNNDPYAYSKMTANSPTFISKIQAAPNTDTWEKPNYTSKDTQYFAGKSHDWARDWLEHPIHEECREANCTFQRMLEHTKRQHWRDWLERAEDPDIWMVHKYTSSPAGDGGKSRIPVLKLTKGDQETIATTNDEKASLLA